MRHYRGHVDHAALDEPNCAWVRVIHPPDQNQGEPLAPRKGGGKRRAVPVGDAAKHHAGTRSRGAQPGLDRLVAARHLEHDVGAPGSGGVGQRRLVGLVDIQNDVGAILARRIAAVCERLDHDDAGRRLIVEELAAEAIRSDPRR